MASLREQNAYKAFSKAALGRLNVKRIENQVGDGMSDLVVQSERGFDIWIEVKAIEKLPRRQDTPWIKGEFRPGQLAFLKEKISWGGHGFVLLKAANEWFLIDPTDRPETLTAADPTCILIVTSLSDIIKYLETMRHEDCPYAAPNYRPGTMRRKTQFCVPNGARNGQDVAGPGGR